ncbi:regulatory protein RecX [Flavonifractor sp. AGMB03687]|uniref:regulatory protein RecX n=1 Tax=Flavonifractor sp. AGMB03687 TaxID=2785133 RepID=UPI001ADEF436|nr:regulatory protein RecX [Flavonifractor sp. AGMB03687]
MRISKLAPSQRVAGRWLCHLEDGTILRITENEIVAFGLCSGLELTTEQLEAVERAAKAAAVRDKAMDLLAARPLSRKELVDKLTARPRNKDKEPLADRETAEAAADRLEELGYLNDESYARTVADHYAAKGWGPSRVREELYRRGVPREYWDGALEDLDAPDDAIDTFLQKKLRGADLTDPKTYQRAANALARRGFRWEDIKEGLRRYGAAMEEEF